MLDKLIITLESLSTIEIIHRKNLQASINKGHIMVTWGFVNDHNVEVLYL